MTRVPAFLSLAILLAGESLAEPSAAGQLKELAAAVGGDFADPRKLQRVEFDFVVRNVWGGAGKHRLHGWKDPGTGALFLDDGFAVPDPAGRNVTASTLEATLPPDRASEEDDPFPRMELQAAGLGSEALIAHAAWHAVTGGEKQALELLEKLKTDDKTTPLVQWRQERVWFHYASMVHAYMQGQDQNALAHGEFLEARYRKLCEMEQPQALDLLAELRRRAKDAPPVAEADIPALEPAGRTAAWIARLQEARIMQDGQPGGVDLAEDPAVQALIRLGEPAIPALLDCFEHDNRLTRSVHFWRSHHPSRTVLGVHEAALTAIMSILRTEFYSPRATGSNVTAGGEDRRKSIAAELRGYWRRFGHLSFDERMMAVLSDRNADPEARQEAASNLATPNARSTYGTTVWTGSFENPGGKNPWIGKFEKPAIFEAILAALDDEIAAIHAAAQRRRDARITEADSNLLDADKRPIDVPYEIRNVTRCYAAVLGDLGDSRAAGPLAERAAEAMDPAIRCWFVIAAQRLGAPSALGPPNGGPVAAGLKTNFLPIIWNPQYPQSLRAARHPQ